MGWNIEDEATIELIHKAIVDSQYLSLLEIQRYTENPELSMEETDVEAADMIQQRRDMIEKLHVLNEMLTLRDIKKRGELDSVNAVLTAKFNVALDSEGKMSEENLQKLRLMVQKES